MKTENRNWLWLYPATILIHIFEEAWTGEGFYNWLGRVGIEITATQWWFANLFFFFCLLIAIFFIIKYPVLNWALIALGVEILLNGLGHLLGTILTSSYSPGLFSGLFIWVPLGIFTLLSVKKEVTWKVFAFGMIAGLFLRAGVILTVVLASKL